MAEEDVTIDMNAAVNELSESLAGELDTKPANAPSGSASPPPEDDVPPLNVEPALPGTHPAPKSWKTEMHPHWGKLDPAVQAYVEERENAFHKGLEGYKGDAQFGKGLRDIISPYQAYLTSRGQDPAKAVQFLLNAEYTLSNGSPEQRSQMFAKLAKDYKIDLKSLAQTSGDEAPYTDPAMTKLAEEVNNLRSTLTAAQQAQVDELRSKTTAEVETFASDPKHAYFNEVSDHIALLLRDPKISLEQAYDQAIWANPVTRAKEQARTAKEQEVKLRKDAEDAAKAALKAKGTNVRGLETPGSQHELVGTMEETMRDTYRAINSRT